MDELKYTTSLGESIRREQVLWILHRGHQRASLAKPQSLHEMIDIGHDADVVIGAPINRVLDRVRSFLRNHPEWVAVWSIPRRLDDVYAMTERAQQEGERLTPLEEHDLRSLGMDLPLGEWADGSLSYLYRIR